MDQELAEDIIESFKVQLGVRRQSDQLASAFGSVAADFRPRGQAVYQFLTKILENPHQTNRYQAAANALSMTNLPQAANALAKHYGRLPEIRDSLVRMGDLAVSTLVSLVHQYPIALGDLFTIGTPDATTALVAFLWDDNQTTQQIAAWYLAGILPKLGIAEVLREYNLTDEQRRTNSFTWVWQPFGEPPDSVLPYIVSRIAEMLATAPIETAPKPLPALDARLIVPLCTIHLSDQVIFSKNWPKEVETLLEKQSQIPEVEKQLRQTVNNILEPNGPDSPWRVLLSGLTPQLQLDLLRRLNVYRWPNRNDWRNAFRAVKYELRTGWHYRCVLLIAVAFSIIAVAGMMSIVFQQPEDWILRSLGLAFVVILNFWNALWVGLGVGKHLEPRIFLRLGLLGPLTFAFQLRKLFRRNQNNLDLYEFGVLYNSFQNMTEIGVLVAVGALTGWAMTGAEGTRVLVGAVAGAVAGPVVCAGAWAVAIAWMDSEAMSVAMSVAMSEVDPNA